MILTKKPENFEELIKEFRSFIQYKLNSYHFDDENGKALRDLYPTKEEYEAKLLEALIFSYNNGFTNRMINTIIKNKDLTILANTKNKYGNQYIYQFIINDGIIEYTSGSINTDMDIQTSSIKEFNNLTINQNKFFKSIAEKYMNKV